MRYVLGLDVGTTGAKVLLVDEQGRVAATASGEYALATPRPLWSEQNPEDWWAASSAAFKAALARAGVKANEIAAIGLTGQMHGLVLLDAGKSLLRPCILWNDQRTGAECEEITNLIGASRLVQLTANPVLPGFTAPKLLWVKKHEPEIYSRIAHVLLPKDYVRFRLTGELASDVSDASGTSLFDVGRRRWSEEMLTALGVERSWMPSVHESIETTGTISRRGGEESGLAEGTPVVAGAGDQAAGGVGCGVVKRGVISVTVGTSGVVFAHTDEVKVEAEGRLHAFCHAVPGAWHLMGVTLAAGGSLRWFRDTLGPRESEIAARRGVDPYEVLMEEAAAAPPGSAGLLFLPYLSGERTPYADPHARGAFIGLTMRHARPHMIRSVIEGVAYSLRDCLELMRPLGVRVDEVRAAGGGARSELWRAIIADVCNVELVTVTSTEGAPYGAALLAGVGCGLFGSVADACRRGISVVSRISPRAAARDAYDQSYGLYRSLYAQLKPAFDELTQLDR